MSLKEDEFVCPESKQKTSVVTASSAQPLTWSFFQPKFTKLKQLCLVESELKYINLGYSSTPYTVRQLYAKPRIPDI